MNKDTLGGSGKPERKPEPAGKPVASSGWVSPKIGLSKYENLSEEFKKYRHSNFEVAREVVGRYFGKFSDFDTSGKREDAYNAAVEYVKTFVPVSKEDEVFSTVRNTGTHFSLYGDMGVGKDFLLGCMVAHFVVNLGVKFVTPIFPPNVRYTHEFWASWSYKGICWLPRNTFYELITSLDTEWLHKLSEVSILCVSDLVGVKQLTDFQAERLFAIAEERYRMRRPFLFTSNLKNETYLTKSVGEEVADRLSQDMTTVVINGKSRRPTNGKKPSGEK